MEDIRIWHLDEADVAPAVARLAKINARAEAHGLAGRYGYHLGDVTRQPACLDDPIDPTGIVGDRKPDYFKVTQEFVVEGEPPKLNGWSFLATLTWDAGTLVTRTASGFTGTIEPGPIRPGYCDHCKTERQRNDTYLVVSEDGTRRQVGSTCVKDFMGHQFSPRWMTGSDLDDMERSFGGRVTEVASPETVLAWAASLTSTTGWVSRDKAEIERRDPSSSILRDLIFGTSPRAREARRALQPTGAHKAEAATVLGWARDQDATGSEYLANVQRLAQAEDVSPRNAGIIGSAVAARHRETARAAERAAAPVSRYVGAVKDKIELDVTIKSDTAIDGDYGVSHLYRMASTEGNVLTWFSSRNLNLESGQQLRIRGTVKGHELYHDVEQTKLTRCKVLEPQAEASAPSVPMPEREAC
jgi:hypothetical protein